MRTSLQTARGLNIIREFASSFSKEKMTDESYLDDDAFVPKWRKRGELSEVKKSQIDAANSIEGFGV